MAAHSIFEDLTGTPRWSRSVLTILPFVDNVLISQQIDTLVCTPSILSKYQQQGYPNIKTIVVAGEACSQSSVFP
jgi:hypothetical protein